MVSSIRDLSNVQGDILLNGLPKEVETFWFFTISDALKFCTNLGQVVQREITSTATTQSTRRDIRVFRANRSPDAPTAKLDAVGANIAFTFKGLKKVSAVVGKKFQIEDGVTGESSFEQGMKANAVSSLQDPPQTGNRSMPDWDTHWLDKPIDGVLLVAGNTPDLVQDKLDHINKLFDGSIKLAFKVAGKVRPGDQKGHEHFGYLDGVSQPVVGGLPGLTKEESFVPPGQDIVEQGTILCGRPGDVKADTRPAWMLDGSFLVFRKLRQNVQDWDKFLVDSSNMLGTFKDQLGARLIGRWKSGCPVNLQADFDDKAIGADPMRNNLFEFDPAGLNQQSDFKIQAGMRMICPIGAHIRKTHPRGDQPPSGRSSVNRHRILRRGIPFGPEISENPHAERGLLFACYQSSLDEGFDFIQQAWANNPSFRFPGGGVDAVMGQTNSSPTVGMKGLFPQDASRELQLPGVNRFVVPRGGEYFFSPSIATLTSVMGQVPTITSVQTDGQAPLGK